MELERNLLAIQDGGVTAPLMMAALLFAWCGFRALHSYGEASLWGCAFEGHLL